MFLILSVDQGFFVGNIKRIFTVEFEKHVASTSIFGIIIDKLYYKKKLCPIILIKIDKGLKINIYYTMLFFNLSIYLKIKSG